SSFQGIRGSHWMSGSCTQDYGSITLMISRSLETEPESWAVPFSHAQEKSTPATYELTLPYVKLAMTGSCRAGVLRATFTQADTIYCLLTPNSDEGEGAVLIDEKAGEIYLRNPVHRIYQGWDEPAGFSGHFVVSIEMEKGGYGSWQGQRIYQGENAVEGKGQRVGAYVRKVVKAGEVWEIRIGSSFTDETHARQNMVRELSQKDFAEVATLAQVQWEESLGKVEVIQGKPEDMELFYTCLYRTCLLPRVYSDVDGSYPAFGGSGRIHRAEGFTYYGDFSLWDTYRAQHPLLNLLQPERAEDMVRSLCIKASEGGWLPIFPAWNQYTSAMIGDHAVSVLADAYVKGIWSEGIARNYHYLWQNAMESPETRQEYLDGKGRRALQSYLSLGYIPLDDPVKESFHKAEQVSRTLEYAYDDFALSQIARGIGKRKDFERFKLRGLNYQHVFDPRVGFVRGKYKNGRWTQDFDPTEKAEYITEGNAWQYTWYVPHDPYGLIDLMGGQQAFGQKLDALFEQEQYWHGNEPGHQIPYLYPYAQQAWKTQRDVSRIRAEEYGNGPGGLTGNEDAGQMCAWYVFSALGFYPVCPGTPYYVLGSPAFGEVILHMPEGKSVHWTNYLQSEENIYIESARRNGKPFERSWISHQELKQGGNWELIMQKAPQKNWPRGPLSTPPDLYADF
ncbi:MAG: GH92 family glycosyl hydrolase, partial [Bacteroidota bacterium]